MVLDWVRNWCTPTVYIHRSRSQGGHLNLVLDRSFLSWWDKGVCCCLAAWPNSDGLQSKLCYGVRPIEAIQAGQARVRHTACPAIQERGRKCLDGFLPLGVGQPLGLQAHHLLLDVLQLLAELGQLARIQSHSALIVRLHNSPTVS